MGGSGGHNCQACSHLAYCKLTAAPVRATATVDLLWPATHPCHYSYHSEYPLLIPAKLHLHYALHYAHTQCGTRSSTCSRIAPSPSSRASAAAAAASADTSAAAAAAASAAAAVRAAPRCASATASCGAKRPLVITPLGITPSAGTCWAPACRGVGTAGGAEGVPGAYGPCDAPPAAHGLIRVIRVRGWG